jgi:1-acyl-sn-glycerol-3-phosphate acyltransferase
VRRFGRAVLVTSAFVGFWGVAVIFAWIVLPVVALFQRDEPLRIRRCQRIVSRSFRIFHAYMRALGLLDARVSGEIPRRSDGGPVVIVANHTTLVDVTAVLTRFPHACAIAKVRYADNPFVGRLLRLSGFISAGYDTPTRSRAILKACERIQQGFDILVFPEGTRSPPGGLLPFQRGAFEIACRADVPVVTLLSRCEPSALTRDRAFWDQPATVAVLTIAPRAFIEPKDHHGRSRALRAHVESVYREELGVQ